MGTDFLTAFLSLLWGVQNDGDVQKIKIARFTKGYVQGIQGEDIHRPEPLKSSKRILVAVLDTGIDTNHPELKNLIADSGFNFVDDNRNVNDSHGHGTHVSGIIALQATNQAIILPLKVVQAGPNAPITPQSTDSDTGTALAETVAKGMLYAIEKGAKVINLSLAWPDSFRSSKMDAAMAFAEKNNVLVVASAANDSTSANLYPCIYPNVICVGAHGPDGAFTHFSNHGTMVDLLAPGMAIFSTWPMNRNPVNYVRGTGYEFRNGTSMAAPYVAGAAAELLARGYSPEETRARLLLGTRLTRTDNLYSSRVKGEFTKDQKAEQKIARFGNLDIQKALNVQESSLVLPERKSRIEVLWNGTDPTVTVSLHWVNRWKKALRTTISIQGQTIVQDQTDEGDRFSTLLKLPIQTDTESEFNQIAEVTTSELNGSTITRRFPISFGVRRVISPNTIPSSAERIPFLNADFARFSEMRTVVQQDPRNPPEYLFFQKDELIMTAHGILTASASIEGFEKESLLNFYRIHSSGFAMITIPRDPSRENSGFKVRLFDSKLNVIRQYTIDTRKTVLKENLIWRKIRGQDAMLWISTGFMTEAEKPPFDPWNPNPAEIRIPRVYYAYDSTLHTLVLDPDELPIQVLPNGKILTIRGTSYESTYQILDVDQDLGIQRTPVTQDSFRMLLGLNPADSLLDLRTGRSPRVFFQGLSTLGNLRVSVLNPAFNTIEHDQILKRESSLESLLQVSGAFKDEDEYSYFVQSHYDLKYYRSSSEQTRSVSLNRYSYIPSLISRRLYFPLVADSRAGKRVPAIYTPASFANSEISEMTFGDPKTGAISRPALYRIKATDGCLALGNLVPATHDSPAKLVFRCDNSLVLLPVIAP